MVHNFQLPISSEFSPESRVWIYQASRVFQDKEVAELQQRLKAFADSWVSHNRQLKAAGLLLHNQFVILLVDESRADASGCSIDKSVHFLKALEVEYGLSLFDRMTFAFLGEDGVNTAPRDEFRQLFREGLIHDDTFVFDNLVKTRAELESGWIKPLRDSWHKRLV